MRIRLKLYAGLRDYLPKDAVDNAVEIDVPEDASPNAIVDRFHVPGKLRHLVLVNGVYAERHERDRPMLKDGDTLAIWPPIAGG
jgi:molybdopterin converting factor small subunit